MLTYFRDRLLIHPLTLSQAAHYYDLGLRERVLTLPVMVALVLSMIWRQIGSVRTVTRLLDAEGFLWTSPVQVSPQALSQRLRVFPAALFKEVLDALLPRMQERWLARQRPCPRRWRGRAGATARCWVWTARRLTRWRARWACCVTGRIRH